MKRDWDCIRAILQALDGREETRGFLHPGKVTGWSEETVSYHMLVLNEAGLIEATCKDSKSIPIFCMASRMTWQGHELFDKLNSETLWRRILSTAKDKGLSLSFEAITILAKKTIESLL